MNSSAARSSSPVVTPGRARSRSSASVRATTEPAAAMRSSSRRDLRRITTAPARARPATRSASTSARSRAPSIVTIGRAERAVVLAHRPRLLLEDGHAVADDVLAVVVAVVQLGAVDVADPRRPPAARRSRGRDGSPRGRRGARPGAARARRRAPRCRARRRRARRARPAAGRAPRPGRACAGTRPARSRRAASGCEMRSASMPIVTSSGTSSPRSM